MNIITERFIYAMVCIASFIFNLDIINFVYNRIKGWNKYNIRLKILAISLTLLFISFEILLTYAVMILFHRIKLIGLFNI